MANISFYEPSKIEDLLQDLDQYKYQPSALKTAMLNRVSDMLSGTVDIVDPSNPFTYLLETTCVNTSFAVQEFATIAKKLYPRLANSEADLYLHMSDYDYLGRFSEPSTANVWFNLVYSDFKRNAINPFLADGITKDMTRVSIQIPRMYTVTISSYTFTLLYPITITQHSNGVFDISYDTSVTSSINNPSSSGIKFNYITQFNNESWLRFSVPMLEVGVTSTEVSIEKSSLFKQSISIPENKLFYYAEVFHIVGGAWAPMVTTHTQEVYDINLPTACLTVYQDSGQVDVYIPPVYIINNLVSSKVRIDIYTTSGAVDVNFSDFKTSDFSVEHTQVDKVRDLGYLTAPIAMVGKLVYISEQVNGGKGRLSFDNLKAAVIDNSIGDRKLPITSNQLTYDVNQKGFTLIKDVDILTDRIYYFQRPVPLPLTQYPISKLDMDMSDYMATLSVMNATGSIVNTNKNRYLIPENTVFIAENSLLRMLDLAEVTTLKSLSNASLLNEINSKTYLSTFYHYVIDTNENETTSRAYDFDTANVSLVNFIKLNSTVNFTVHTDGAVLSKAPTGFELLITAAVSINDSMFQVNAASVCLLYTDENGDNFYMTGSSIMGLGVPVVYRFNLTSSYDVDNKEMLYLTSFVDKNNNAVELAVPLLSDFKVIYYISERTSGYTPSDSDVLITNYIGIPNAFMVPSQEVFSLRFGTGLPFLNTRIRNVTDAPAYQTYTENVPLVYAHDEYELGGVITEFVCVDDHCEILPSLIHRKGDPVLDGDGAPVYKYRIGDVKLLNGVPISVSDTAVARSMTLLFSDYKSKWCNTTAYVKYVGYVKTSLTNDITVKMKEIQDILLENTEGYMVVPNTINNINVNINNSTDLYIDPSVRFMVTVYVSTKIFNDYSARANIDYTIIKGIDTYLSNSVLIKTELISKLYTDLKEFVTSISIPTFVTDVADYIVVKDKVNKLTLRKALVKKNDGKYDISEDVVIDYVELK